MRSRSALAHRFATVLLVCSGLIGCERRRSDSPRVSESPSEVATPTPPSFTELRAEKPTRLTHIGAAPQPYEHEPPPEGVAEVTYRSGELDLKAWYAAPENHGESFPAVVYFHSGHAFGRSDFDEARVFLDAGFAVMTPMLRGENGNPGNFELFWGEFDDAVASVNWLAKQPEVDADNIYTFGHSIGGGLSALLSLADPEVPVRHGGSCGGYYPSSVFTEWADTSPFDVSDTTECELRTLAANVNSMRRDHHAYIGVADPLASTFKQGYSTHLHRELVLGDHFTSLGPSMFDYARRIHREAFGDSRKLPRHLQPVRWKHPDRVATASVIDDAQPPELWNVKDDPYPLVIEHYPGEVRCPVMIIDASRSESRGDVAFPYGFEPIAKLTEHPNQSTHLGSPLWIDLRMMMATGGHGSARFEVLQRNNYGFSNDSYHGLFHWPATGEVIREPPGGGRLAVGHVYDVSPGQRYVVAFSDQKELLVWETDTKTLVGRSPLPLLSGLDGEYLAVAELGFSPDGAEFAAVLGQPGKMRLMNWHWISGAITANFPVNTAWSSSRPARRQHRRQLQFLENGQGWLSEFGRIIVDRDSGERRGSLFFGADLYTNSTPRLLAGNRLMSVFLQDKSSLYHHLIATIQLPLDRE